MPAIWRPNVSGALPDVDVEVGVAEDASSKGTKRKRACTKGAMRARGKVSVEVQVVQRLPVHGKRRSQCKEWVGLNLRARS